MIEIRYNVVDSEDDRVLEKNRTKMKMIIVLLSVMMLSGCGRIDRWWAGTTGGAVSSCVNGVTYYQFTSGATVAYTIDGRLIPCK